MIGRDDAQWPIDSEQYTVTEWLARKHYKQVVVSSSPAYDEVFQLEIA